MSVASASIFLSTSHSETTSTGATWMRRKRSHLPYQPQPIRPTRGGFMPAKVVVLVDRASPAAPAWRKFRRSMEAFPCGMVAKSADNSLSSNREAGESATHSFRRRRGRLTVVHSASGVRFVDRKDLHL